MASAGAGCERAGVLRLTFRPASWMVRPPCRIRASCTIGWQRGSAEADRGRQAIGHLHRFNRGDIHVLCAAAGLRVEAELADPLPLRVHTFFADTAPARAKAVAKAAFAGAYT